MKILVVTDHYYPDIHGGYEVGCSLVCKELIKRGYEITVLTSDCNKSLCSDEPNLYRILPHSMLKHKNLIRCIAGCLLKEQKSYRILKKFLSKNRDFDIVYIWSVRGLFMTSMPLVSSLTIPTVYYLFDHWAVDSSGHIPVGWFSDITRFPFVKKMLRLYYRIVKLDPLYYPEIKNPQFCSTVVKKEYEAKNGQTNRPTISFGIEMQKYHFIPKKVLPLGKIVWVGRPCKEKGFDIAVKSVELLHSSYPDITMDVYGGFNSEQIAFVNELIKNKTYIKFHKAIPHDQISDVLGHYDFLIFSSIWNEPYGMVPLEAMASGVVVVGTGDGGSKDYCKDGENCLLYSSFDYKDCASKIQSLIESPEQYHVIREKARSFIQKEMQFSKTVDQIEKDLSEVLQKSI